MVESYEEIKAKNFKFGGIGDYLRGTLTDVNKTTSPDSYGKLSHIYSVKAEGGSFYNSTKNEKTGKFKMDDVPTVVKKGEDYTFFISNDKGVVISAMKDIKIGQKFEIKFAESKPTTKGNDVKVIKVFAGRNADQTPLMDKEWQDAQKTDDQKANEEFEGK